jgi:hypothetical protein
MPKSVGVAVGELVVQSMLKAAETCSAGGKVMQVQKPNITYNKAGKKPMPQPAYSKQASPLMAMLTTDMFKDPPPTPARRQKAKPRKPAARGPVMKRVPVRAKTPMRKRTRQQEMEE